MDVDISSRQSPARNAVLRNAPIHPVHLIAQMEKFYDQRISKRHRGGLMTETVKLRPRLDLVSAPDLLADLMSADKTGPLEVDAGEVIHLGALGLQILIAAGLETRAAGGQMRLRHVGDDLEEQLHVSGLTIQNIEEGAT